MPGSLNKLLLSLLTFVIPYVYQYLRPTMDVFYTFGRAPLPPNALGYADPKPQPEVIDLTDDAPAVKQEPAAPAPAPMVADDEEQYTCPISMELMKDPVMADDGHMYDLEFLVKYFSLYVFFHVTVTCLFIELCISVCSSHTCPYRNHGRLLPVRGWHPRRR